LKAKPETAFPEIAYITVSLSCVSARNCESSEPVIVIFSLMSSW